MSLEPPRKDDPRTIRLAHLRVESGVRSIGQLCYLVGFFSALGTLEFLLFGVGMIRYDPSLNEFMGPDQLRILFQVLAVFLLANTLFQVALGVGLTHLQSWARWLVIALTLISLLSHTGFSVLLCFHVFTWGLASLVVGGAVHLLILQPLITTSAGVVFSKDYQDVIRASPEIRSRMHWLLKGFIGLILGGVACFVAYLAALYLRLID